MRLQDSFLWDEIVETMMLDFGLELCRMDEATLAAHWADVSAGLHGRHVGGTGK